MADRPEANAGISTDRWVGGRGVPAAAGRNPSLSMIVTSTGASVVTLRKSESRSITELSYAPGDRIGIHSVWPSLILLIGGSWRGTCPALPESNAACSLFLVPPGVLLTGYAGSCGMHCQRIELKTGLQYAILAGKQSIHRGGEPTRRAMKIYWALQQADSLSDPGLAAMIDDLLLCLAQDLEKTARRQPPTWLDSVLERLHLEYRRPPTVRDLAQTASVDPCHLARTFRRYLRCTIGQYVRQLRLEDAIGRMLGCNHRLAEIAAATGFADQAHFTRTFKQEVGITPRDYRRRFGVTQSTTGLPMRSVSSL